VVARKKRVPEFDHTKDTTVVVTGKQRFLLQEGNHFTRAEFNRLHRRWVPEPQYVPEEDVFDATIIGEIQNIEAEIKRLEDRKRELRPEKTDG